MSSKAISSEFGLNSKYIDVLGSNIHYVDEGTGDPVLFLHGNPTSSYLWRNIIPYLSTKARCIAPDLIGMGKSDKPAINYRFSDHARYVEAFIEKLALQNITLVVHDWGSALGFHYASKHENNVKGMAFMEALVKPKEWSDFPTEIRPIFKLMRTPLLGWFMISVANLFVKKMLPNATAREYSDAELRFYASPFQSISSRKPVRQWPLEIPIAGKPEDVYQIMSQYSHWLTQTNIPKLLFHAQPGAVINSDTLHWCEQNFSNLETVSTGRGIHYLPEENPHLIGEYLAEWYQRL